MLIQSSLTRQIRTYLTVATTVALVACGGGSKNNNDNASNDALGGGTTSQSGGGAGTGSTTSATGGGTTGSTTSSSGGGTTGSTTSTTGGGTTGSATSTTGGGTTGGGLTPSNPGPIGANGLYEAAQGCAYLLVAISADELNRDGCIYSDENGAVAIWQGTSGALDLGVGTTAGTGGTDSSTGGSTTGSSTGNTTGSTTGGDTTGSTTGDTTGSTNPSIVFPAVEAFPAELADDGTSAMYSSAINSALLTGPVVGQGMTPISSDVTRSIPFITEGIPPEFDVLHAIVYTSEFGSAQILAHLRNNTSEVRCFVRYGALEVYDSNGQLLASALSGFGFADGSIALTSTGFYTDTCLGPNEIVYINDLLDGSPDINEIVGVRITNITASNSTAESSNIAVQPVSYEVVGNDINVTIANRSAVGVSLDVVAIVMNSDAGKPLGRMIEYPFEDMAPGAEYVVTFPSNRFDGASTSLRVTVDYELLSP